MNDLLVPRLVMSSLRERLGTMPAVVVTGSRQAGKSTLVQHLLPTPRRFITLDDFDVLELANRDPDQLIGGIDPITVDEVQRQPHLLMAVKRAIDAKRTAGRFLLTGSANLLLMESVSESLAGRASYLNLWPLTRLEQLGLGRAGLWDELLGHTPERWRDILEDRTKMADDWRDVVSRGGYPTPCLSLSDQRSREIWFEGYVRTYLERDLQNLASVASLSDFRRLMRTAALRVGGIVNQTDIARDVGLSQPTVHRHLNLLEASFALVRLPAYAVNRTKRLIKAPKLFWGDTGVGMYLSGGQPSGALLENLVLLDLLAWQGARLKAAELHYWRTSTGDEVDFVIEAGNRLLPVEVKSSRRLRVSDAHAIRQFRLEYGDAALPGLILYDGNSTEWLTGEALATPWWRVI